MAEVITKKNNDLELTPEKFEIVGIDRDESEKILRPSLTYLQDAWRRLKKNKLAIVAGIILLLIILLTAFGPMFTKDFTKMNTSAKNLRPSATYWFGTDNVGRDLFARVCQGGRVSILIAIICTVLMAVIGCAYGGVSGYYGGLVDDIMMRCIEVLGSLPNLVLTILLSVVLGRSIFSLVLAISLTSWIGTARIVRGKILQLKEQEFVLAAQSLGAEPSRVIIKHLLPNTFGLVMVDITFSVPSFIFYEAFLSYIGLGVQSPNTSWGALASAAQSKLQFYPYQLFFPCLFISLVMLCFNLFGDGLNDALDPRLRQ
ncbi:ABC transporter permease [Hathewaya histolytica]|uniref:Peptide ABC transporter permease n=1 Tax=Hathewaya histolytica TaxID=1498 RepID=A0A4U9RLG2_HATHI|nr:ABC transporter permease [Hathewaya histolytica]VTQ92992.1 peptide ABC transporter permease [Hathewaya histolytica]